MNGSSCRLALCGAALVAAGCQSQAPPFSSIPTPPQQVETGSRFVLRTPLQFPPGGELVFQNEQLVAGGKAAPNMPFCRLRPTGTGAAPMPPGTYTVGAISYDQQDGAMTNVTRITLGADPKKPTHALACGSPAGMASQGFLTTQQIYNAIGGQFSMDLLR